MKQIFLALLVAGTAGKVAAQAPTITAATNNPVAGDIFYLHHCDTNGISKGPAGAAVTWNLAALNVDFDDTMSFVTCASTPLCDSFPGSTLAEANAYGYQYFIADANGLASNGYGSAPMSFYEYFSDPATLFSFPMTYGTVRHDSNSSVAPAMSSYYAGRDTFTADGYGTLILPSGTYSSVLRVHNVSYRYDSTDGYPADHYRFERYMWFQAGYRFPLAMMFYDTSGGDTFLSTVMYATRPPVSVPSSPFATARADIYPNPASGTLNISYNSLLATQLEVSLSDVTGRVVTLGPLRTITAGTNMLVYDISTTPPGVYLLRLQAGAEVLTKKLVITE